MRVVKILEKDIQRSIIEYLTLKKYFFWRNNSGAYKTEHGSFIRFGAPGSPDICLIKDKVFYGLEVKRKDGVQSDAQREFEKRLIESGGRYHTVTCIDDVEKIGL